MSIPEPQKPVSSKIAWLDSIRFLSALLVVVCHTRASSFVDFSSLPQNQKTIAATSFYFLTRMGREAVLVFFVLSGYLVLGKTTERLLSGKYEGNQYAVDRIARVYPPLLFALSISLAACMICSQPVNISDIVVNLIGIQGTGFDGIAMNPPLWSLAYEMWFYALLWGAFSLISHKASFCSIALLAASFWVFTKLDVTYLFCWISGGLFYFHRPQKTTTRLFVAGTVTMILFIAIEVTSDSKSIPDKWRFLQSTLPAESTCYLVAAICFAWFISQLVQYSPKGLWAKGDALIGKGACFSYSLYLVHYPLIYIWNKWLPRPRDDFGTTSIGWFILQTLAVSIPALGVYYITERQTSRIKHHILKRINFNRHHSSR